MLSGKGELSWNVTQKEQQVLRKLEENGWEARFVGGCVRDVLRGEPCDDIDITTNAAPQEVMGRFWCRKISSRQDWPTAQ